MAKKRTTLSARRMKDKWKAKKWYRILAPEIFDRRDSGETPADEPGKLPGRMCAVSLNELTGDFSKMHIKLNFKIIDVVGSDAHSIFVGHNFTSEYIRRLTRRKQSKTDGVFDVRTLDNYKIRVKPLVITDKRIRTSVQKGIRGRMGKIIEEHAKAAHLGTFLNEMISGELGKKIYSECRIIYPLKRVEIRKSEILEFGVVEKTDKGALTEEEKLEKDLLIRQFTGISGVGIQKANVIYDSGIKSLDELSSRSIKELEEIEGVGPYLAKNIKGHFEKSEKEVKEKIEEEIEEGLED